LVKTFIHRLADTIRPRAESGGDRPQSRTCASPGRDVKRRVSPKLFEIPGVTGLGEHDNTLTVYLKDDSVATRRQVETVVHDAEPSAKVAFCISGAFRAHAI
jgi:hypothetical protein